MAELQAYILRLHSCDTADQLAIHLVDGCSSPGPLIADIRLVK